jgi:hypothetical protein
MTRIAKLHRVDRILHIGRRCSACWFKVAKTGTYTVALQDLEFMPLDGKFRLRMARTADEKQIAARTVSVEKQTLTPEAFFLTGLFPTMFREHRLTLVLPGNLASADSVLPRTVQSIWKQFEASELIAEDVPNVGKVLEFPVCLPL